VRQALVLVLLILVACLAAPRQWAALPGGNGRIAFTRDFAIFTIAPDGRGEPRVVGTTRTPASWPAWSPDGGSRLVFLRIASPSGLFIANADGHRLRRLIRSPVTDLEPAWSPDGTRIAFARSGRASDIFVVNVDGTGLRRLTNKKVQFFGPSWSSDGHTLAFWRAAGLGSSIYTIRADGTGLRRIASGAAPDWSPDGSRIVFARFVPGENADIWVMQADGTGARDLTAGARKQGGDAATDNLPTWSPDGTRIVFESDRASGDNPRPDLYVMNSDGSAVTRLTTTPLKNSCCLSPAWQPLCTITGTPGDDHLAGASGSLICGRGGSDTISAGDSDGHIFAGPGSDAVSGGVGNDVLAGDSGADRLDGGLGNDLLAGGAGNDRLHGDVGGDDLRGGSGGDELFGDEGNDQLFGDGGRDVLRGGSGNDLLTGGLGRDDLYGGPGNDTLFARDGVREEVVGGAGFDVARIDRGLDHVRGIERLLLSPRTP